MMHLMTLGHVPIKWFMRLNICLPREEIIAQLRAALDELMSYGIYLTFIIRIYYGMERRLNL